MPSDPVSSGKTCHASTGELAHTADKSGDIQPGGNCKFQCVDGNGTALDVVQVQPPTCATTPPPSPLHMGVLMDTLASQTIPTHISEDISNFVFLYFRSWQYLLEIMSSVNSRCRGACPTIHQAWSDNKWWSQTVRGELLATHALCRWHCCCTLSAGTERQSLLLPSFQFPELVKMMQDATAFI